MHAKNNSTPVSVIIPTYNRSNLLRLTVESVLAQTYPHIEIIVVDDGSTDDTASVMEQYAGRVIYIRQVHQHGARRAGFRVSLGEYINFLDHDDLMMPTKIERQVQILNSRPEIGLVHCGYYYVDENGKPLRKVSFLPEGNVLKELVFQNHIWSGAPLIRRLCLEQAGFLDQAARWSDTEMWLRIALAGFQFACVQEPLGEYRITPNSQMANTAQLEEGTFAVLDKVFANSRMPADILAQKDKIYADTRHWISCRYYADGNWDNAQRNWLEALRLHPRYLEHSEELMEFLSADALSIRVRDPIAFITDVLDHLPAEVKGFGQYRSQLLCRAHVGLALQSYGFGQIAEAKRQLTDALTVYPSMFEQLEDFARLVGNFAMQLPISDPLQYVSAVFDNLPANAQRLKSARVRALNDVNVACAFEDYFADRKGQVVRRIFKALRNRPSLINNRGVVSIFLKSLPSLLSKRRSVEQIGALPLMMERGELSLTKSEFPKLRP